MKVLKGSEVKNDFVNMKDLVGKLVAFVPLKYKEDVPTKFGEKDAIVSDVLIVAEKTNGKWGWSPEGDAAVIHRECMFLQGRVIGKLKNSIGAAVCGVVTQVPTEKGNDAYDIDETSFSAELWPKVVDFTERNYKQATAVTVSNNTVEAESMSDLLSVTNNKMSMEDIANLVPKEN